MKTMVLVLLLFSIEAEAFTAFVLKRPAKPSNFMMYTDQPLTSGNSVTIDNYYMAMQPDGNFVVYRSDPFTVVWTANTWNGGCPTCRFLLQGDGNLVVRDDSSWKWSSNSPSAAGGRMEFRNQYPYLVLFDPAGNWIWASW